MFICYFPGADPEIIADSRLPSTKTTLTANNSKYTVISHPYKLYKQSSASDVTTDSQPRASSLVNFDQHREPGPPSYDSYLRRKSSKRKRVNFRLDGVTSDDTCVDQLRSDMRYPTHAPGFEDVALGLKNRDVTPHFQTQPKPLRSSLKKPSQPRHVSDVIKYPSDDEAYFGRLRKAQIQMSQVPAQKSAKRTFTSVVV